MLSPVTQFNNSNHKWEQSELTELGVVPNHISLDHYSDTCVLLAHLAYMTWSDI
jgi:hypothetical protein